MLAHVEVQEAERHVQAARLTSGGTSPPPRSAVPPSARLRRRATSAGRSSRARRRAPRRAPYRSAGRAPIPVRCGNYRGRARRTQGNPRSQYVHSVRRRPLQARRNTERNRACEPIVLAALAQALDRVRADRFEQPVAQSSVPLFDRDDERLRAQALQGVAHEGVVVAADLGGGFGLNDVGEEPEAREKLLLAGSEQCEAPIDHATQRLLARRSRCGARVRAA